MGRTRRTTFVLVATALAGLSVAACSNGTGPGASAPESSAPPPPTVADERPPETVPSTSVTTAPLAPSTAPSTTVPDEPAIDPALVSLSELVDAEGRLSVDAALGLFAAYVGPLPDVQPITLDGDAPVDVAGLALRRLRDPEAGLGPDTVTAIDAALSALDDAPANEVDLSTGRAREITGSGGGEPMDPDEVDALIADAVATFEAATGHDFGLAIRTRTIGGTTAFADQIVGGGDRVTGCEIRLPGVVLSDDAASAISTIAHEVWHCFQLDVSRAAFHRGAEWVIEGQAEYAGEAFAGGSTSGAASWNTWLLGRDASLWGRSYDAIGLYAVARQEGVDPWTTMLPMLGHGNVAAVETLFGNSAEAASVAVAGHVVRAPAFGAPWESDGPGITGARASVLLPIAGDGNNADLDVESFGSLPLDLGIAADGDIVVLQADGGVGGIAAVPGAGTTTLAAGVPVKFCLLPEGCMCPNGEPPGGVELPSATAGEGAAGVASLTADTLSLTGWFESLEDACRSIVGVWQTDLDTQLGPLMGGTGGTCQGPFTMTFTADGAFTVTLDAVCVLDGRSATGTGRLDGTYTADATTFTVADITGEGTMTTPEGFTMPLPILDGYRQAFSDPTPYVIETDEAGVDVLTYTYAGDAFSFTRVG